MTESHSPYYELNRAALYCPGALDRHRDKPLVALLAPDVSQAATQFASSRAALDGEQAKVAAAAEASKATNKQLATGVRAASARLAMDLPGFDLDDDSPSDTPLDLLADGRRVAQLFQTEAAHLPYAADMLALLTTYIDAAAAANNALQAARVSLQAQQATTRAHAIAFHRTLVLLRRVLQSELGASHYDFQRLRVDRGRPTAETDDLPELEVSVGDPTATTSLPSTSTVPSEVASPGNGHSR